MKKIILSLILLISVSAFCDTGKVSVAQVTGLNALLNGKLSQSAADSRYNLVSNNKNAYNYFVPLDTLQTNSYTNHFINGNIALTNGGGLNATGDIYTPGNIVSDGAGTVFQSHSTYQTATNGMLLLINSGGTLACNYLVGTINTDNASAIYSHIGNSTNSSYVLDGYSGNPLTRHIISSTQTQITPDGANNGLVKPNGILDVTSGSNHLFSVYSDKASMGIPFSAVNVSPSVQLIATSAGTTALTAASPQINQLTGSLTHSIVLPNATTLPLGTTYVFHNSSTSPIVIKDNSSATLGTIAGGGQLESRFYLNNNSTAAGGWMNYYNGVYVPSGFGVIINNSLTFNGTDGTSMTFPSTSKLIAAADGSNITALQSSTTATTQAVSVNNTTIATTAFVRLYTQPINASATVLTPAASVTWTPALGTNRYTLIPAQAEVINMGTIPASLVGTEITLVINTSGTTTYAITAGTNLKMQGALNTGTVTAMTFVLKFLVLSTTSVVEVSRTIAM